MVRKFTNNKTIIIAEAGVNHNGDITLAKKLIDVAKNAGADFVKFQSFKTENLVKKSNSQFKMLKKLEISENDTISLIKYCKKKKINFLSTPFDLESLKFLFKKKIFNIKISSGEITHLQLLKQVAKRANKIFISTGMSNLSEIQLAIKTLNDNGAYKKKITVLHCHTSYPTMLKDVNLLAMTTIKNKLKVNVGYSDHTLNNETAIAAVALGAKVIEKHITLSRKLIGPDHKASMEPDKFKKFVALIRNTEKLMGSSIKRPSKIEIKMRKKVRKSVVARRNIYKGEVFTAKNTICKRPEGGISSTNWSKVIGKKSKFNFRTDDQIKLK